jgi:Protein of unknown function (DUF3828)
MVRRSAVGAVLIVGLAACSSNAEQPSSTGTANGAAAITADADREATSGTAGSPSTQPEGAPGYDNSVRGAMNTVRAIYEPYMRAGAEPPSAMDPRADYSTAFNRALTAWRTATADAGVTGLSEADWICGCQDWDAEKAVLIVDGASANANGYDVTVRFSADGSNPEREVLFSMIQEGGRWKVDDMVLGGDQRTVRALLAHETRNGG